MSDYGNRPDGTAKGAGFFGELNRPDGNISTELSIGVNFDDKETQIPLLVPTLSRGEIDHLLSGKQATRAIVDKAAQFALGRMREGKSPFAGEGEQVATPDAVEKAFVDSFNGKGGKP